jgi:hypothetical protein
MPKQLLKFVFVVIFSQVISYYFAGIIAQVGLGASEFYPPSPNAISYLRDLHDPTLQLWILHGQALRGLLFAFALFPFREHIWTFGTWTARSLLRVSFS